MDPVTVRAAPQNVIFISIEHLTRRLAADKPRVERAVSKRIATLVLCTALVPGLWLAFQFREVPHLGVFHDDALYAVGAKAFAEGHGHKLLSLPGAPWQTKYPPLYPLLLSLAWPLGEFPKNLTGLLSLSWLWLPALALVSREVFKDLGFSPRWSLGLAAMVAMNPLAGYFAASLMPELMAATLMMAALTAAQRDRTTASALFSTLAVLTKTSAAPLLISIPVLLLWRNQRGLSARFALLAWPPFIVWMLWAATHRAAGAAGDYYLDYLGFYRANHSISDVPSLAAANLPVLVMGVGRLLSFVASYDGWANYVTTLAGLVGLLGFFRLRSTELGKPGRAGTLTHYHAFAALFLLQLAVWNFTPHERFLLPILPLLLAGLAAEFRKLPRMSAMMRPVAALAAIAICLLNARGTFLELPSIARDWRSRQAALTETYRWICDHTPPDASFAAADDPLLYLHTGRTARGMHFPTRHFYRGEREKITAYFTDLTAFQRAHGLPYSLILDRDHEMDLAPAEVKARARTARSAPGFETLHQQPGAVIRKLQSADEVFSRSAPSRALLATHP